jgi:RNA polymerase sigma-70 factor (ECF subfamily)
MTRTKQQYRIRLDLAKAGKSAESVEKSSKLSNYRVDNVSRQRLETMTTMTHKRRKKKSSQEDEKREVDFSHFPEASEGEEDLTEDVIEHDDHIDIPDEEEVEPHEIEALEGEQRFLSPEEEREIIRRVQEGDTNAFEKLVQAYSQKAYFVALGYVNNHDEAVDLSQDAFVKAFKAIKSFDLNSPFFPWFYKIIKNHCLNQIKKSQRSRHESLEQLKEEKGSDFPDDRRNPRELYSDEETRIKLWQSIELLKPDFREIIIMKHFHNLSYKEIAETLDIPIGTVMSRLFNARQELREKFLEALGEN